MCVWGFRVWGLCVMINRLIYYTGSTVLGSTPAVCYFLQDLEEQKRTKYKINGTATTAIEKSNPIYFCCVLLVP